MDQSTLYRDIAGRCEGDIYLGVVGPVRTGKSTFIKRFMELLVLPNLTGEHRRERAQDELPQSGAGRTIMTTQPKFVPNEAVEMQLRDEASFARAAGGLRGLSDRRRSGAGRGWADAHGAHALVRPRYSL